MFDKFSLSAPLANVCRTVWRICILIPGCKGSINMNYLFTKLFHLISSLYSLLCFNFSTVKEKCLSWHKLVEVIDPEKEAKYYFNQVYSKYESCRLKPLISFHNSSTGKWHLVNLTGNQFIILNAIQSSVQVKVCWIIFKLFWSIG